MADLGFVRRMKHIALAFILCLGVTVSSSTEPPIPTEFNGLTQTELAAKVGFPLRVYTTPAKAKGGPAILFWVYYQRTASGKIEEKEFGFQYVPLKVCYMSAGIDPSRFLSLERDSDFQQIFKYNAQHAR